MSSPFNRSKVPSPKVPFFTISVREMVPSYPPERSASTVPCCETVLELFHRVVEQAESSRVVLIRKAALPFFPVDLL